MSFIADKIVMDGLTYDDVLLIPAYSEVLPKTVELTTKFSRNIELKVPFVTAAMDTVTEAKMAIAIAREGGIGVIHKNMSIEEQARQVAIVKRAENGMIYDPVTIKRGSTVRDALALMSEYRIGGIPVVDDERYLVGIVTNRDLRFEKDMDKRIDEVMTKENIVTTNQSTDMEAASRILQEHKIEKLPVVDKEGKLGMEKVILKKGQMSLFLVNNPDSPYYQSEAFGKLLGFIQKHPRECNLREQNGKRSIVIKNVPTVEAACGYLQEMEKINSTNF